MAIGILIAALQKKYIRPFPVRHPNATAVVATLVPPRPEQTGRSCIVTFVLLPAPQWQGRARPEPLPRWTQHARMLMPASLFTTRRRREP